MSIKRSEIVQMKLSAAKACNEIADFKMDYKNKRVIIKDKKGEIKHVTWSHIIYNY